MTRSTHASGTTIAEALGRALADLLDIEPETVELHVGAPGLDALTGQLHLDLEVVPGAAPSEGADQGGLDDDLGQGGTTDTDEREATQWFDEADEREEPDVPAELDEREGLDGPAEMDDRGDRLSEDVHVSQPVTAEDLDAEADAAADFLEGLLDALDLPGDLRMRFHDDHVEIEVVEVGSGVLIGRRGQTLEAIQEILRCTLQRQFQRRARVKVDVEGYRARRLEKLVEKAEEAIDTVLETGRPERLEPMDVFERKTVHHLVAKVEGLSSRSQGREPARRVVIERE